MEPTILGIVLDSSAVIAAERKKLDVADFIDEILHTHGPAKSSEASARRKAYIEELIALIPVHPITTSTGWLAGQIEGQEAAKGNVLPFSDLLIAVGAMEQGYGADWQYSAFQQGPRREGSHFVVSNAGARINGTRPRSASSSTAVR
jgi:predicted nucleic acid-binding protein